jgi:hypothetical protein
LAFVSSKVEVINISHKFQMHLLLKSMVPSFIASLCVCLYRSLSTVDQGDLRYVVYRRNVNRVMDRESTSLRVYVPLPGTLSILLEIVPHYRLQNLFLLKTIL